MRTMGGTRGGNFWTSREEPSQVKEEEPTTNNKVKEKKPRMSV